MELRWIESLVAVTDHGGFLQAAIELGLSQPTISGHVKDLEAALGTSLVDRRTRPVALTPAGEQFIRHARLILGEVEAGVRHMRGYAGPQPRGIVTIGTYPSASAGYLPHLLQRVREEQPGVEVVLEEMAGGEMEGAAESGRLDIFLRQSEPPLSRSKFALELLWRERFFVVIPRDHAWAQDTESPLDAQELVHAQLIMTGRFQPETLLGHPLWRDLGSYPAVAHHVQHPQSLLALVEGGAGLGLTTELPVRLFGDYDVVLRRIDHPAAVREVYVNWSLARAMTDQTRAIV